MATTFELTIAENLGLSDGFDVDSQTVHTRGLSADLGLSNPDPTLAVTWRRSAADNMGFDDIGIAGLLPKARNAVGLFRQPLVPPQLVSGQTRGYYLTTAACRIFPRIDRVNKQLVGSNPLGWTYEELEKMQGCLLTIDWLDTAYLTAEIVARHDGYDSIHEPSIADDYEDYSAAMINDLARPGWKPVNALNPLFVALKDLYRLRAMTRSGVVQIAVEVLVPGGDFN